MMTAVKTFKVREAHDQQTAIRLQLLKNGWRPLPTAEKVAFQKGWPVMDIDEAAIRDWPLFKAGGGRSIPAVTTAIQLQGTMLAIDVDVNDGRVAAQMLEILEDCCPALANAPLRDSGGSKFMLLCRTETPYAFWKTPKWIDEKGADHMVEVYGGAATRYFSCYGPHTIGGVKKGAYEIIKEYQWDDGAGNPMTMTPADLPLITEAQMYEAMRLMSDRLAEQGWTKDEHSYAGEGTASTVYDLTDDMTFQMSHGELLSYHEAMAAAASGDNRCSATFLGEHTDTMTRCRLTLVGDAENPGLMAFDHKTWTTHFPLAWKPKPVKEQAQASAKALGAALKARGVIEPLVGAEDWAQDLLDSLMDEYVHVARTDMFHPRSEPFTKIKKTAVLNGNNQRFTYQKEKDDGTFAEASTTIGKAFMMADYDKASRVGYDPRQGMFYGRDKPGMTGEFLNAFDGLPELDDADPRMVELMRDHFLPHLIPDPAELQFFLDWLTVKYRNPEKRHCAILMLADNVSGTGRGTLFSALLALFGKHASKQEESSIVSRFNGYLASNVLVLMDEVGSGDYGDRDTTYHHLKNLVDPVQNVVKLEEKFQDSYSCETFASFVFATNRSNGIQLRAEDRRFAVLTNGTQLDMVRAAWSNELMDRVRKDGHSGTAAALRHIIGEHVVQASEKLLTTPPHFAGRAHMIRSSASVADEAIDEIGESIRSGQDGFYVWRVKDFKAKVVEQMDAGSNTSAAARRAIQELTGARAEAAGLWYLRKQKVGVKMVDGEARELMQTDVVTNAPGTFLDTSWELRAKAIKSTSGGKRLQIVAST